jgi:phosphopantetheinyl transferase
VFRVATNRFHRWNDRPAAGADRSRFLPSSVASSTSDGLSPSVWTSAALPETELRSYSHLLTFDEVSRSRTLKLSGDRERFLTSRVLLRLGLSLTVANRLHPSTWRFSPGRFGKPEMCTELPLIHFNIAHAAGAVVVAIDPAMPIGVDVEPLEGLSAAELPSSVLSETERSALDRCDESMRVREFVRLWTLKEAHAKRIGLGVHLDFASFDIDWQPGRDAQVIEMPDEIWETRLTRIGDGAYQVSAALGARRRPVSWRGVSIAKLAQLVMQPKQLPAERPRPAAAVKVN